MKPTLHLGDVKLVALAKVGGWERISQRCVRLRVTTGRTGADRNFRPTYRLLVARLRRSFATRESNFACK